MYPRLLVTSLLTAVVLAASASAQVRGIGGFGRRPSITPGFATFGESSRPGFGSAFPRHPLGIPTVLYFSDLGYEPVSTQPVSVVVVQPPAPTASARPEESPAPAKPLLLELHGDRWEQVERFQMTGNLLPKRDKESAQRRDAAPIDTLLIFRDGRYETTSSYAVIGDALFEQSNYWISGSWTKKIAIADLDLAATIKANQQRGVIFKLPSGPNEVVLRP